ncbi:MAG: GNAT family N-acetyltransferase [Actinomycetes bacterium]
MTTTNTATLNVRSLEESDEPAVLELLGETLAGGPTGRRTAEFFRWKHRENPFGPSPGLVAEHDGQLIGVRLFLSWRLRVAGRPVNAVRAVDTATHPDFQGLGIFRRLTLDLLARLDQAGLDLVFNTPNSSSRPGYLKMGWVDAGTVPVSIRPMRPLRVVSGLRAARRASAQGGGHVATSSYADVPPCPLPAAAAAFNDPAALRELLSNVGEPEGLHTPLSVEFLRWRYAKAPDLDYRCLLIDGPAGLAGVAFGRLRRRGPLVEFTLADVITRSGDVRSAQRLLKGLGHCGADHVIGHFPREGSAAQAALRSGFLTTRRLGLDLVANTRSRLPVDAGHLASWRLTLGDLEVF